MRYCVIIAKQTSLGATGHAFQLDRPDPGTVGGAGDFQRAAEFARRRPPGSGVPDTADPWLYRVLRQHDVSLPALPVSAVVMAAADGPQGLPARARARRGGADTADSDGMEKQRRGFRPTHRELLHLLRALDRRSADGRIPAGRTDNGRTLLVAWTRQGSRSIPAQATPDEYSNS
jgi:hypothetical protein